MSKTPFFVNRAQDDAARRDAIANKSDLINNDNLILGRLSVQPSYIDVRSYGERLSLSKLNELTEEYYYKYKRFPEELILSPCQSKHILLEAFDKFDYYEGIPIKVMSGAELT